MFGYWLLVYTLMPYPLQIHLHTLSTILKGWLLLDLRGWPRAHHSRVPATWKLDRLTGHLDQVHRREPGPSDGRTSQVTVSQTRHSRF